MKLGLGIVAGLGLLTKYSTAVLFFVIIVHFVTVRGMKQALASPGTWLATATCLLIISMHVLWLFNNGFPTLHYAAGRAGEASALRDRFVAPLKFLGAQAVDIAPALLLTWISGLRPGLPANHGNGNLQFLVWMTFGPPAVTVLGSLATGMGVRDMWGAPMWNLTGLLVVLSAAETWSRTSPRRLGAGVAALFAIGMGGFVLANVLVPELESRPSRIQWPDRALARAFGGVWRQQVHLPLKIVAADGWLGGLVAMRSVPRPSVWIDADYRKAPWITPDAVTHDGALVLWRIRPDRPTPSAFTALKGIRILGQKSFSWPATPGASPLHIGYAILPPAQR